jgi:hypothetical protein
MTDHGLRTEPLTPSEVIEYRRWVDRGDGLSPFEARRLLATFDAARADAPAGPRYEDGFVEGSRYHRAYQAAAAAGPRDAQADDLMAALAERNIYSRGDLDAALQAAMPPEDEGS